jgi:GDP-L-fucose synthase
MLKPSMGYNSKILVTGGSGMVGHALKEVLPEASFVDSKMYDLRNQLDVGYLFITERPDYIVHLAGKVGGVKANSDNLATFYYDNIMINTNVLEAARKYKVKKVLSFLSTCVYPNKVNYPLTEEQIHNGPPHFSNYAYAYAKRMLDIQSRAYRDQFDCNFITAIPNNLFGEYDNFHLDNSHLIPAIIRKIYEAKNKNKDVTLWGDGNPLREFTYSKDLAKIVLLLLQHKKPSSNSKLLELGWKSSDYTTLEESLNNTCRWFTENYPNVRGVK